MSAKRPLLFRHGSFARLWLGQVLSLGCLRTYQIALMWHLLSHTEGQAGFRAGFFMVLGALPSLLFVRVIGRVVDQEFSKRMLMRCDLLAMALVLAIGGLVFVEKLNYGMICLSGFLMAWILAYYDPSLNKAVPELVEEKDLEPAVALISSTQSMASFGGAVVGAIVIDQVGLFGVCLLAAVGYAVSFLCNASLKFPDAVMKPKPILKEKPVAGWKILEAYPLIKKALIGFGGINFFSMPTLVVLPLYVSKALGGTATLLGIMEASLWVGMLLGAFSSHRIRFTQNIFFLGGACLSTFGLALIVPAFWVQAELYIVMLFIAGFSMGVNNVKFVTYFQKTIPQEIKGRFFALLMGMINATLPLAYFVFGIVVDITSPPQASLIQGVGVVVLASYFFVLVPSYRLSMYSRSLL